MSDFEEAKALNQAFVQWQRRELGQTAARAERLERKDDGYTDVRLRARVVIPYADLPKDEDELQALLEAKQEEVEEDVRRTHPNARALSFTRLRLQDGSVEVRCLFRVWMKREAAVDAVQRQEQLRGLLTP